MNRGPLLAPVAGVVVLVALAGAWLFTPLGEVLDVDALVRFGRRFASSPFAPLILAAVYLVGALVAMPLTLLLAATIALFGAWPGAAYAMAGALLSGTAVYAIGRLVRPDAIFSRSGRIGGPRLAAIGARLVRHGLVAIALVRLTPIPYSLINLVAGAVRVRPFDFVVGTALGLLPVVGLFAGVARRVEAWLVRPDAEGGLVLTALVVVALAAWWALRRWAARRQENL